MVVLYFTSFLTFWVPILLVTSVSIFLGKSTVTLESHSVPIYLTAAILGYGNFLFAAVTASVLSLSYRFLTSAKDNDTASPTDA